MPSVSLTREQICNVIKMVYDERQRCIKSANDKSMSQILKDLATEEVNHIDAILAQITAAIGDEKKSCDKLFNRLSNGKYDNVRMLG